MTIIAYLGKIVIQQPTFWALAYVDPFFVHLDFKDRAANEAFHLFYFFPKKTHGMFLPSSLGSDPNLSPLSDALYAEHCPFNWIDGRGRIFLSSQVMIPRAG